MSSSEKENRMELKVTTGLPSLSWLATRYMAPHLSKLKSLSEVSSGGPSGKAVKAPAEREES